ncbi:MAG: hypothetical protein ACTHN8_05255 [Angustibacter sp.]
MPSPFTVDIPATHQISSTQWTCTSGSTSFVVSGMKLTLPHS